VTLSQSEVVEVASAEGFDPQRLEKVLHLMNLLNLLNAHPYLKGKWLLKGGTALNLFLLDFPRLSVDIDLNYIGALDREEMLEQRPTLVDQYQNNLSAVLPLNDLEKEFLNILLDEGRIDATFLTDEPELQRRIRLHPLLQWKALDVRRHKRLE